MMGVWKERAIKRKKLLIKLEKKSEKRLAIIKALRRKNNMLEGEMSRINSTMQLLKASGGSIEKFNEHKWKIAKKEQEPCDCPICGKHLVRYARILTATAIKALILLVRFREINGNEYAQVTKLPNFEPYIRAAAYASLVHWGLVESAPNADPAIATSGCWRATEKGAQFVYRKIKLPKTAWVFLNEVMDYDDDEVYVEDVFKERFHYQEMMLKTFGENYFLRK
jgi:hypothetical protein